MAASAFPPGGCADGLQIGWDMNGKEAERGSPTGGGSQDKSPDAAAPQAVGADRRLLELLVCPITKSSLDYDPERQELISRVARLAFPIREGVPLMTVEAARHLDDDAG
ncbi:MAG: Trm112 family protein [Hyphomicrobiaceae bacterium]